MALLGDGETMDKFGDVRPERVRGSALIGEGDHVERELMLIKLRTSGDSRQEVKRTADIFRGQIVDVTADTYTVQLVGPSDKLDAFLRAISNASILEVVRSGVSGVGRGERVLSV